MEYNKKIIFFSSGLPHHKFLIKFLKNKKFLFSNIFFDKKKILPPFKNGISEKKKQLDFEKNLIKNFKVLPKPNIITDLNSKKNISTIKKLKPDLGIVFGARKLSKTLICCFKDGIVNIHRGYIQDYRGLDSEYWTLYHKEYQKLGATIHYIDSNLDTGDIIDQKFIKFNRNLKLYKLRYLTTKIGCEILIIFLKKYLLSKKIKITKQTNIGKYYSFIPNLIMKQVERVFKKK